MRPWKAPNRPKHEISQNFNDGVVKIYEVTDTAAPGRMPVKKLSEVVTLNYEERKLGIQRYFSGQQNQIEISRVIRVPIPPMELTNQQMAETEDGRQYNIRLVQGVRESYPPSYDLTLEKILQNPEKRQGSNHGNMGG